MRVRLNVECAGNNAQLQITKPATFGLGADCQKPVVRQKFEHGTHTIRVSPQVNLPVGGVEQDKGKHSVQQGSHLLDAKPVIEVEQDLTIHVSLAVEFKLLLQLRVGKVEAKQHDLVKNLNNQ